MHVCVNLCMCMSVHACVCELVYVHVCACVCVPVQGGVGFHVCLHESKYGFFCVFCAHKMHDCLYMCFVFLHIMYAFINACQWMCIWNSFLDVVWCIHVNIYEWVCLCICCDYEKFVGIYIHVFVYSHMCLYRCGWSCVFVCVWLFLCMTKWLVPNMLTVSHHFCS